MTNASDRVAEICAEYSRLEGPMLPILHAIQDECGFIGDEAKAIVAQCLNLSRAEVHGVASFYHDFRDEPEPRAEVQVCRAEACQSRGVEALVAGAQAAAGDRVRIATVYCLGLCSVGPCARVGDRLFARLDAERLQAVIDGA